MDVFEEASTWSHLRKMFYNKRMESQLSDYQGMREKMKKFLLEINERANASPTEQELFNEVTVREKP